MLPPLNPLVPKATFASREISVWPPRPSSDRVGIGGNECKSDFYRCGLDIESPAAAYKRQRHATYLPRCHTSRSHSLLLQVSKFFPRWGRVCACGCGGAFWMVHTYIAAFNDDDIELLGPNECAALLADLTAAPCFLCRSQMHRYIYRSIYRSI